MAYTTVREKWSSLAEELHGARTITSLIRPNETARTLPPLVLWADAGTLAPRGALVDSLPAEPEAAARTLGLTGPSEARELGELASLLGRVALIRNYGSFCHGWLLLRHVFACDRCLFPERLLEF